MFIKRLIPELKTVKILLIVIFVSLMQTICISATKSILAEFNNLKKKEQILLRERNISEKKLIIIAKGYRNIYNKYPSAKIADDALFSEANLYEQLFRITLNEKYFDEAIDGYKTLVLRYPNSILADNSMYAVASLYYTKGKRELALSYFKELIKLYPKSEKYSKADSFIKKIEGEGKSNKEKEGMATLVNIRHWTGERYTRVVLDIDKETKFAYGVLENPDRLFVDLDSTFVSRELLNQNWIIKEGFLKGIRVGQYSDKTGRVVLDFDKIKKFDIFSLNEPFRVVIDIYSSLLKKDIAEKEAAKIPEVNSDGFYSLPRQLGLKIKKIVIDPGHGGKDPGAIGPNGTKEKDVVLSIGKYLKKYLENEGYAVYLTRDKDEYLSLEERTAIANSLEADLFLSIHANSNKDKKLMGIETYYLNFAVSKEEMEVAARENATSEKSIGELKNLIKKIMLNSKIKESREFASIVHNKMISIVKNKYWTKDLGVKKAPFYVLIGAQMPAILLEVSYISNNYEESRLAEEDYKILLANAIKDGVIMYGKGLGGYKERGLVDVSE